MRYSLSATCRVQPICVLPAACLRLFQGLMLCLGCLLSPAAEVQAQHSIALQPEMRIAVIGNTLADRMQHAGWLETLLQSAYPQHRLVVRDLGLTSGELRDVGRVAAVRRNGLGAELHDGRAGLGRESVISLTSWEVLARAVEHRAGATLHSIGKVGFPLELLSPQARESVDRINAVVATDLPSWGESRKDLYTKELALAVLAICLLSWVVMSLWNWLMPSLLPAVGRVDLFQAGGLLILSRILFGGFRGHGGFHRWGHWRFQDSLSEQERERFHRGLHRLWEREGR